jgi:hypothetical protein
VAAGQVHWPLLHTWAALHLLPQRPQLFTSPRTSRQRSPHQACPWAQQSFTLATQRVAAFGQRSGRSPGQAQARPLHTRSPVHAPPQVPQFSRLLVTDVQVPPQLRFAGPTHEHLPFTHCSAPLQGLPQAPQLL